MTDIATRLRACVPCDEYEHVKCDAIFTEAADEIERLIKKGEAVSTMAESYGQALEAMGREVERLKSEIERLEKDRDHCVDIASDPRRRVEQHGKRDDH